ncbi:MAG: penicillin-insensitive murein endopeptidase, partial [Myxococcota bacterium]
MSSFRAVGLAFLFLCGCWVSPSALAPSAQGPVGLPHRGVLTDAAPLKSKGAGFRRFRKDDIRYGHPRLVSAITAAAAAVERNFPGSSDLVVADLSGPRGGKIPRHRSHRTGRDADLLFYVLSPAGRPLLNTGFDHFGTDGLARTKRDRYVRIDLDRTWALVRHLSLNDEAQVQWMFVARWLKALLL